ncbi:MAG: DNA polymerase I [Acidobacteriota bacterium]
MANPERLILVDGSSLIYRVYYAIPASFATSTGLPTNATYGFATMFRKVLAGKRPACGAVVFDAPGKTFRDEKYGEYKAQRRPMDEALRQQLPWIDRVVEAHRFPMLRVPGYEADDVIGTLTRQGVEAGMEVFIISGDKDFAQLISGGVRMVDTLRDVVFDPEVVAKKWGVPPEHFVDLLALMGDKIDNIPGVPGIGQKGAAKLLADYGSLDAILEHTAELKGRQRKTLEENHELALLSRELATIDQHVPLDESLDDLRLQPPPAADLNSLFKELEFYSLLSEEAREQAEKTANEADYGSCLTLDDLDSFLRSLPAREPVAIYAVIDAFLPVRGPLAGLAVCPEAGRARWLPIAGQGGLGKPGIERLRSWLEDEAWPKVTHNAKALRISLLRQGIDPRGIIGSTLLESFLVDPVKIIPHQLGQIAREYLQQALPPSKRVVGSGQKMTLFSRVPVAKLAPFACQRADAINQAWPILRARLEELDLVSYLEDVELPLAWLLAAMELDGVAVDPEDLSKLGDELGEQLREIEETIYELAGSRFNIGSLKQLSKVLFEDLGLPVIKRTKSGYSTNAEVLTRLAPKYPIAGHVIEQRKLAKLINTYTDVLQQAVNPHTGRIHTTFQQTVSATGRLISTEPDLQRTPIRTPEGRRIRRSFVPRQGWTMLSADWSQIELRLLAHYTRDPLLVEAFAQGEDIHRRTAGQLFDCPPGDVTREQRGVGKLVNFSTIYGQGATALGHTLGVPRKTAQSYIDGYFEAYRGVREWLDRTIEEAHQTGYVTTLLGRRRVIPELSSNSFMERQYGERIAANTPIQGSAADLCKIAMLAIARRLETETPQARLLLQIHDELLFEAPPHEVEPLSRLVRQEMEGVHALDVPLVVDVGVGDNWDAAH